MYPNRFNYLPSINNSQTTVIPKARNSLAHFGFHFYVMASPTEMAGKLSGGSM